MDDASVTDLFARALATVTAANVPEALQEVAFTTAVALLGGTAVPAPAPAANPATQTHAAPSSSPRSGESTGSAILDTLAGGLGLDGAIVSRVFRDSDGEPVLNVKANRLPTTKSEATYEIAMLTLVARQMAGIEEYTDGRVIRETVKDFGRLDQSNHAKYLKEVDQYAMTTGSGRSVARKLTRPGIDVATELVTKYGEATS